MARRDALLRLHKMLTARRNELHKRMGMDMKELGSVKNSAGTGDSADAAFDSGSEEITSQLVEIEGRELIQIERALKRLKAGTYGVCEGCHSKIPVMRLDALPYSTLCIKCQREMESDANWLQDRQASLGWDQLRDSDGYDEPRVNLADMEMDVSK